MALTRIAARAAAARAVARIPVDEVFVAAGIVAVVAGVALISMPAALISAGLVLLVLGVGRMRA
jgi:hypothetical protein